MVRVAINISLSRSEHSLAIHDYLMALCAIAVFASPRYDRDCPQMFRHAWPRDHSSQLL
jgi:hypothetical protein